ncbi:MAG: c-type cytochrome [Pirellulaceae bacterium]
MRDSQRTAAERARVLDIMALFGPAASNELLLVASRDADVMVRRRATYYLGTAASTLVANRLAELLDDTDGQVRRLACESLVRTQQAVEPNRLAKLLASSDRFESFAARRLLEQQPAERIVELVASTADQRVFIQAATALMMASPSPQHAQAVLQKGQQVMTEFMSDRNFVDLLRTFQLAYHRSGLTAEDTSTMTTLLTDEFPASNVVINRELIRLLSYLHVTEIADRYLKQLEVEPLQADRIHLAIHVALMGDQLGGDQKLQLFRYLEPGPNAGSAVADYLQQVSVQLGQTLTEDEMTIAIDQGAKYPAAALAAVLQFPETLSDLQKEQLKQLDSAVATSESETAKRLRVAVVALLARDASEASWQYLRSLYETSPDRRVEVTVALAEDPVANWKFVIDGLQFLDNETLRNVLPQLRTVNQWPTEAEPFRQVIMTAERLRENGGDDAIRLLEHWKGFASQVEKIPLEKAILAWRRWYAEQFPQSPAPEKFVKAPGGSWNHDVLVNHIVAAQKAHAGSPEHGALVFEKAQCAKCHRMGSTGESMGPDLTGLAKRFRPSEVLESVLEPSKVISDQYASKTVVTKDGKVYTGILGSGANGEYVILQSDGSKKQLALTEVDEIDSSTVSAMPAGLLNSLTMDEITDLFAYLYSNQIGPVAARPADSAMGF